MIEVWKARLKRLASGPQPLPADVVRLVIAARIVAVERQDDGALRELDQASEAFASRVPWGEEP